MSVPDGPEPADATTEVGAGTGTGEVRASGRARRRGGARRSWACRRRSTSTADGVDEADGEVGVAEAEPRGGLQGRQPDGPLPVTGRRLGPFLLQLGHPALEPLGLRELGVGDLAQVGAVLGGLAAGLGELALEARRGRGWVRPPGPGWCPPGAARPRPPGPRSRWWCRAWSGSVLVAAAVKPAPMGVVRRQWSGGAGIAGCEACRRSRIWRTCSGE